MKKTKITNGQTNVFREFPWLVTTGLYGLSTACALAANLTVNSLNDAVMPGDRLCTLREAVGNATTNTDTTAGDCPAGLGADKISFNISGLIDLTSPLVFTASEPLMLDGAGQRVTLNGNNSVQIIRVNPSAVLIVNNLTFMNGFVASGSFIGINGGGAISNQDGNVTVMNSTFAGNSTTGRGGAINHFDDPTTTAGGIMEILNSTFIGNSAFNGGGLANSGPGILTLVHTTVVGNRSVTPLCPPGRFCATVISDGGGIVNTSNGSLTVINSIVAGNTNVIKSVAGDLIDGSDIHGSVLGGNNNLIGTAVGIWSGLTNGVDGNIVGIDVNTILGPALTDNGSPTQTLALLPGSPAVDAAAAANCLPSDQRGVARPQGAACDIGAFETAFSADLAVSQSAAPNPVMERDAITWTITIRNNGPLDATNVKLTDNLAGGGLNSIVASASQGSCTVASTVITCNLGSVAKAGSASVTVKATTTKAGTLTSSATVSADQSDNRSSNNTTTLSTSVQPLLCNGLKPTIVGTPGNDNIKGTRNKDVIHSLGGKDIINAGSGNDVVCGGEGQDVLKGEGGSDSLDGGASTDSCDGGAGTDNGVNCEVKISIP